MARRKNSDGEDFLSIHTKDNMFVYFTTIPYRLEKHGGAEIAKVARKMLYGDARRRWTSKEVLGRLESVRQILEKVYESERKKELAFINYLQSLKKKDIPEQIIRAAEAGDWKNFMLYINLVKDSYSSIELELQRLLANIEDKKKGSTKDNSYYRTVATSTGRRLTDLTKFLTVPKANSKVSETIINYVTKNFGAEIFEYSNGKITLNQKSLSLFFGIVQILVGAYEKEVLNDKMSARSRGTKAKRFNLTKNFEDMISKESDLLTSIHQALTNPLQKNNLSSIWKKAFPKNFSQEIETENFILAEQLKEIFSNFSFVGESASNAISVINNERSMSEVSSALVSALEGAWARVVGYKKDKPDALAAYLNIDVKEINEDIYQSIIKIYKKLDDFSEKLSPKKSGKERLDIWNELKNEINTCLVELKEKQNIIANLFLLEENIKDYNTLGIKRSSFDAGSLGVNLTAQITKIVELAKQANLSGFEVDELIFLTINSAPSMIGQGNLSYLQGLFSSLGTFLLFGDYLNIVDDAVLSDSKSSMKVIHLLNLQGVYVPYSVVIQRILAKIKKMKYFSENNFEKIAKISISGYAKHPSQYDRPLIKEDWEAVSLQAQKSTHLTLAFYAGFVEELQAIFNPNA